MNTLLSRKNIITIMALLALLLILPIILFLTRRRQEIRPRALTGNVNLHLTPLSPPNVSAGDEFDEVISIDVTNNDVKVTGADLVVLYDKTKLEVKNIFPFINDGDYFTDAPIVIYGQDYEGEGNSFKSLRVSVVNRANPLEGGTQLVATVQFKALANGSAIIKFPDDNSLLQVVGYNSLTPAATPPTATPTPTGLPSATPSVSPSATPTSVPVPEDYVAYWNFDAGSGELVEDSSGNGHNGTWYGSGMHWITPGAVGNAAGVFGGPFPTPDYVLYVLVPDADSLDFTNALTISAWVKLDSLYQDLGAPIVAKGYGGGNEVYALDFPSDSQKQLRFYKTTDGYKECKWDYNNSISSTNTWYYLSVVYAGNNGNDSSVKIYLNNVLKMECLGVFPTSLPTNTNRLSIGSRQSGAEDYDMNFAGQIDELMLFNRALTEGEINTLYNLRPSPTPT